MELKYRHPNWSADVEICQLLSPQKERKSSITDAPPTLDIKFHFDTLYPGRVEQGGGDHTRSLHIKLFHSATYMSYDKLYRVLEGNLHDKWGEAFDMDYRHFFIHDMIEEVHKIIHDECNKGRRHLDLSIRMTLVVPTLLQQAQEMKNNGEHDCIICLEQLGKKKDVMCMPCSHMFHEDCIATWLRNRHSCPLCRYDLRAT